MRGILITNPKASTSSGWSRDVVIRTLAAEMDLKIHETKFRGHGTELAFQAAVDEVDVIITLGGDGTINEAINGIKNHPGHQPVLAPIPGGLANVFPRALGYPPDPLAATGELLSAISTNSTRTIPLGKFNDRWFGFNAGVGFDAGIVQAVEEARAKGNKASPARYLTEGIRHYFADTDRTTPHLQISATTRAGEKIEVDSAFMLIVQNTSPWSFAGPIALDFVNNAEFDRGLEAVALTDMSVISLAAYVAEAGLGVPPERRTSSRLLADCATISVKSDWPMPTQVDGDSLGLMTEISINLVQNALTVLVPNPS